MKRLVLAMALITLTASAYAGQEPKAKEVRGEGCVQSGVEARCLVLRDLRSGKLYNLLAKEPRPGVGEGIEFTGVPFEGVTYCMQGAAVEVTAWKHKDSLKCTEVSAPKM